MLNIFPSIFSLLLFISCCINEAAGGHSIGQIHQYQEHIVHEIQGQLNCDLNESAHSQDVKELCKLLNATDQNLGTILRLSDTKSPPNSVEKKQITDAINEIDKMMKEHFIAGKEELRGQLEKANPQKLDEIEGKYLYGNGKRFGENESEKLQKIVHSNIKTMIKMKEENHTKKMEANEHEEMRQLELIYECQVIVRLLEEYNEEREENACSFPKVGNGHSRKKRANNQGGCCTCCGIPFGKITKSMFLLLGACIKVPSLMLWYSGQTLCYVACNTLCGIVWPLFWTCVWWNNPSKARLYSHCKEPPATAFAMISDNKVSTNYEEGEENCSCWPKMRTDIRKMWKSDTPNTTK